MSLPLAVGICENELSRDLTFLKAFAGAAADLRVTPLKGGRLDAHVARLVSKQIEDVRRANLKVAAVLVHHDADTSSTAGRIKKVRDWFKASGLDALGVGLVVCAPKPCIERWLCYGEALEATSANPAAGCDPWKKAWVGRRGNDLDRVRAVARTARNALNDLDDFGAFLRQWDEHLG